MRTLRQGPQDRTWDKQVWTPGQDTGSAGMDTGKDIESADVNGGAADGQRVLTSMDRGNDTGSAGMDTGKSRGSAGMDAGKKKPKISRCGYRQGHGINLR